VGMTLKTETQRSDPTALRSLHTCHFISKLSPFGQILLAKAGTESPRTCDITQCRCIPFRKIGRIGTHFKVAVVITGVHRSGQRSNVLQYRWRKRLGSESERASQVRVKAGPRIHVLRMLWEL
jgi:hypothetical protein